MSNAVELMLNYHQQTGHYPGALVHVEQEGRVLTRQVSGRLSGAPDAPVMAERARFRIASLTKPMVSMVVLMLVDEGRVALATPIAEILPELAGRQVHGQGKAAVQPTLEHLLTHTSGFAYAPEILPADLREQALATGLADMAAMSRAEFLQALAGLPLVCEPGTRFLYGYSTDLLGLILERLDDAPLDEVMRKRLFVPLGMQASGFRAEPDELAAMPRAFDDDLAWHRFFNGFQAAEAKARASTDPETAPLISGGGGLISTLDDVCRFARAVANGGRSGTLQLLTPATFQAMVSNRLADTVDGPAGFIGGGWGFGLGGAVRRATGAAAVPAAPGEYTWSGVTGQSLFVNPGSGWFAVMLSSNTASRVMVRFEFRRAVSRL